jgi:hypothetical protein
MMSFVSVLLEAGTAYPPRTHRFISTFVVRIELFFYLFCVVFCFLFYLFVLFYLFGIFFLFLVFVLYLVLNIACVSVLSILDCRSVSL